MTSDSFYTYEYDYENRLTKVAKYGTGDIAAYHYDALGRRIEKIEYSPGGNTTTRYYYDGWKVLTETDAGQSRQRDFIWGNYLDEALVMVVDDGESDTDHYYAHDHLFSPVALMEDDGDVMERYEYDAYGELTRLAPDFTEWSGTEAGNPIYFTGQRLDTIGPNDLEIMYYKNRYYYPQFGRFITRDPIGERTGIGIAAFSQGQPIMGPTFSIIYQYEPGPSLYQYVQSNPAIAGDIYGLKKKEEVCCKIKQRHKRKVHWGYGVASAYTTCTQGTISNPKGFTPEGACKCRYKDRKDITVYDSHDGPCCWCRIYLVWNEPYLGKVGNLPLVRELSHGSLVVLCDNSESWDFDVDPNEDMNFFGVGTANYNVGRIRPKRNPFLGKSKTFLGSASCSAAKKIKDNIPEGGYYSTASNNCHDIAKELARRIRNTCP